ncbi:hypothetical protein P0R31_40120 [Bradyrhizobium yuanmingense]|nr:hypothetical protein [Bradyrhizobium yuanmingense]MDF0523382.1 hypothetical protein [Bradyrhizobium yuanmingense]
MTIAMHRVLKPSSWCFSFYGWNAADKFIKARRSADSAWWAIVFITRYA